MTEIVEQIMGRGNGGSVLFHNGTSNADKEGTTVIVEKYSNLPKKTKQERIGQIILSSVRKQDTRIPKFTRMAVNGMVEQLCMED